MNTLKRRMFKDGNEVNTSLSPAILTYVNELGIDPEGKTAAELQAEIQKKLSLQDAEDAPGAFRTFIFDYKDPLDYAAAGLTAAGITAGAGIALKTANTARKLKKIKDAAARAATAANPVFFKQGNKLNPLSYNLKPKQTALYGTGSGVGVGMLDDDSIPPTEIRDDITNELEKLIENEKIEEQRKLDFNTKENAAKLAKQKAQKDKDKINATLGFLKDAGETFDKEENERISKERRYNANALMQEIGSAMAQTGSIDEGLALGATTAAKRISEEKLAQKLVEGELNKKMLEDSKLKETTVLKIIEDYGEQASDLEGSLLLKGKLEDLKAMLLDPSKNISGLGGFFQGIKGKVQGAFGQDGELLDRSEAVGIVKFLQARMVQDLLDEKGKTISDADRALIKELLGNLESTVSNRADIINLLNNVSANLNNSISSQRRFVSIYDKRYASRIPELDELKIDFNYVPTSDNEENNEVIVNQSDVIAG